MPTTMDTIKQTLQSGDINPSNSLLQTFISEQPSHIEARILYSEVLCADEQYDKADKQLATIGSMSDDHMFMTLNWRSLIRSADYRRRVFTENIAPKVLFDRTDMIENRLAVLTKKSDTNIKSYITEDYNGAIDLDDFFSTMTEVFDTSGDYYWVDNNDIDSISFNTVGRLVTRLWRSCTINFKNGESGNYYIPAIYPHKVGVISDCHKLGLKTYWVESGNSVLGVGLRSWLYEDELHTIHDFKNASIHFYAIDAVV